MSRDTSDRKRFHLSTYTLKWTFVFFNTRHCDSKDWAKFRRLWKRTFGTVNAKLDNYNKTATWYLNKERIQWIKDNAPEGCSMRFLGVTDKQFGESEFEYITKRR